MTSSQASATSLAPFMARRDDLRSGRLTPRILLEENLARIESREADLHVFTALAIDDARAAADASSARWKSGRMLSRIDGMAIGVKDVIETIDMPTGMGSPLYEGWRSNRDSASVRALREAGAIILGKTVTTEFAASEPGPTRNPWDIERTPGGSSSGSAAGTAAGFFSAGLGTQVIGSILRPASYCGVVGFKPTFGAINRGGSHDFMSQSSQGVLAASLADAWQTLREIAVRAGGDPGHPGLGGPSSAPAPVKPTTLALLETAGWADASDAAKTALFDARRRLERAGVIVIDRNTSADVAEAERAIASALPLSYRINTWESRWPLNTYRDRDETKLSDAMLKRARESETMTQQDYRDALAEREHARRIYARLANSVSACMSLSAAGCAPLGLRSTGNAAFVVTGSMLGTPSLSLPVLSEQDLPLGLQVLGFRDQDAELFAIAAAMTELLPSPAAHCA